MPAEEWGDRRRCGEGRNRQREKADGYPQFLFRSLPDVNNIFFHFQRFEQSLFLYFAGSPTREK